MLAYLHHLWFDPISADEQFSAFLFIGLPLLVLGGGIAIVLDKFWEWYNEE